MPRLFTNNAVGSLAAAITDTDTSLELQGGEGANFPNPTAPDYFMLTLENGSWMEIVKVTARATDVLTIERAQEGSTAEPFYQFDLVELRVTAGAMNEAGTLVRIAEVVTTGSQSTISFSSIPALYRDLELRILARGTVAATFADVRIRANGDTGSNYDWSLQTNNGTVGEAYAQTAAQVGIVTGANSPADAAGGSNIIIPNYRGTVFHKLMMGMVAVQTGASATNLYHGHSMGRWKSTAAINALSVYFASGNFVDGSVVTLYGRT